MALRKRDRSELTPLTPQALDPWRGPRLRPGSETLRGRVAGPDRGVYPGSFNPLTTAHLAIAEAALDQHHLTEIHLVVSRAALGKEQVDLPLLQHRLEVLERAVTTRSWLRLVVTEAQLITDIAAGYGVVVMGADKWAQIHDAAYYPSVQARDDALATLPTPAIAPRPPHDVPDEFVLDLPDATAAISSSRARAGDTSLMAPEAVAFDRRSGAWSDPARYREWVGVDLHEGKIDPSDD